ncbi:MAG: hypothetical protein R3E46_04320 [Sedimenticolaceae bacterium]
MPTKIEFVFVGEGPTDKALIPHIESLCIKYGADEVRGIAPDLSWFPEKVGKKVSDQVRVALQLEPRVDAVFIHRDSDSRDPSDRKSEIESELVKIGVDKPCVKVIPIQEIEAWLLVDEQAIRDVADNPRGGVPVCIPKLKDIENTASPKEVLMKAIQEASDTSGKRLRDIKRSFGSRRRILIERLDINGPICNLESWKTLESDISTLVNGLVGTNQA